MSSAFRDSWFREQEVLSKFGLKRLPDVPDGDLIKERSED